MSLLHAPSPLLIDADDAVLVLIDFQPKLMLACKTLAPEVLLGNALGLAEVAAAFELPVITTGGHPDDPLLPPVIEAAGSTRIHVDRHSIDAWQTPEFVAAVEATGRRTLVVAGITTDLCVMLPALSARAEGYTVQVIVDASGCFTRQIEDVALMRLSHAGVMLNTWAGFAAELHRGSDWQQGVGPKLMQSFSKHAGAMGLIGSIASGQT